MAKNGFPSIESLAEELIEAKHWIADGEDGIDVRLQVVDGGWQLHTGDAQYDTDHRGYWGVGWLTPRCNARDVARELIEEAKGDAAQCGE